MAWQRKTPFGYMVRGGETTICPAEANAVRNIFTRYLAGASYSKIAEEMSKGNISYHQHTPQWNKHMVKRILENGRYLGTDVYPRLVSDEDFLAVQLQREDRTDYAPCPAGLNLIREKAVCAVCGSRIKRDSKSHGRTRWVCKGPNCGAVVHISDEKLQTHITRRLQRLAATPAMLTSPSAPKTSPSMDAIRIENELNLCFNRSDINPGYMKTLIFAAAAERYAVLPNLTSIHDMEVLRQRMEAHPATESDLQELLAKAVRAVRIGGPDYIELELTNGQIIGKEQNI